MPAPAMRKNTNAAGFIFAGIIPFAIKWLAP